MRLRRDEVPAAEEVITVNDLDEALSEWRQAGLISFEQARAIAAFESGRVPEASRAPASDATDPRRSVTGPAEAVGYVGAALALGAIALILGDLWRELLVGGRLVLVGLLTVALFGGALGLRGAGTAAMQRLMSVLFAASIAGAGWFAWVVATDLAELRDARAGLVVGLTMVAIATPVQLRTHRALVQLAMLGSLLIACVSALGLPSITPTASWFALVVGTVGVAWFVLGLGGWLRPSVVAEVAGAFVASVGVQIAAFDTGGIPILVLGVLLAGILVALAVRSDRLHHLVAGALALFVFSPQLVFEVVGDAIGAPATLLLVGLLLVLLAVGLGRARREVTRDTARPAGGAR